MPLEPGFPDDAELGAAMLLGFALLRWAVENSDQCLDDHPDRRVIAETLVARLGPRLEALTLHHLGAGAGPH
jgi:hypothetical protein